MPQSHQPLDRWGRFMLAICAARLGAPYSTFSPNFSWQQPDHLFSLTYHPGGFPTPIYQWANGMPSQALNQPLPSQLLMQPFPRARRPTGKQTDESSRSLGTSLPPRQDHKGDVERVGHTHRGAHRLRAPPHPPAAHWYLPVLVHAPRVLSIEAQVEFESNS